MGNARFTRRARLNKKTEFERVFEQPNKKSVDSNFAILTRPNRLGFPRLGLAISKKTAKSAAVRNRLKRIVRESFRHHQHELGSIDCVVVGRGHLSRRDNAAIFHSLKRHWAKLANQCAQS